MADSPRPTAPALYKSVPDMCQDFPALSVMPVPVRRNAPSTPRDAGVQSGTLAIDVLHIRALAGSIRAGSRGVAGYTTWRAVDDRFASAP